MLKVGARIFVPQLIQQFKRRMLNYGIIWFAGQYMWVRMEIGFLEGNSSTDQVVLSVLPESKKGKLSTSAIKQRNLCAFVFHVQ